MYVLTIDQPFRALGREPMRIYGFVADVSSSVVYHEILALATAVLVCTGGTELDMPRGNHITVRRLDIYEVGVR